MREYKFNSTSSIYKYYNCTWKTYLLCTCIIHKIDISCPAGVILKTDIFSK